VKAGGVGDLAQRQARIARSLEALAACLSGFVVLAPGALELALRAAHFGASPLLRIISHQPEPYSRNEGPEASREASDHPRAKNRSKVSKDDQPKATQKESPAALPASLHSAPHHPLTHYHRLR
jgi:hypothetical protein